MEKIKKLRDVSGQPDGSWGVWVPQSDIDAMYGHVCKFISGMGHDTPDKDVNFILLLRNILHEYRKNAPGNPALYMINGKLCHYMERLTVNWINERYDGFFLG